MFQLLYYGCMLERFEKIIHEIKESEGSVSQQYLVDLFNIIRPYYHKNHIRAKERLLVFIGLLSNNAEYQQIFSNYIVSLLKSKNHIRLFTELGISANTDFFSELKRRLNAKILPPAIDKSELTDLLQEVFYDKNDYHWVNGIDDETWMTFFALIELPKTKDIILPDTFYHPIINSLLILGNRISTLGLEPDIMSRLPHVEQYHSDFLALSTELHIFLNAYQEDHYVDSNESLKQLKVILSQCRDSVQRIRKSQKRIGTSIKQVYTLLRIDQNINRFQMLLKFLDLKNVDQEKQLSFTASFFKQLVHAESLSKGVRAHIKENTDLLAYQVIEHTSSVGKKYITVTKKQYFEAVWAAMKGGVIIVCAVIIKAFIGNINDLALLPSALLYSLNYATAFVIIYVTHSALATKQPSMTASYIANALSGKNKGEVNLEEAADTIIRLSRSQFASVLGNLIVVVPLSFLVAWAYFHLTGSYFFSREKAINVLTESHPLASLMILYAAITGVFLFLSGLITGYYENKIITHQIPKRIREHKTLLKRIGARRLNAVAAYIEKNAGGLIGNIFLGFFLGSASAFGKLTGLPFDIRHITISAGNFALGTYSLFDKPIVELIVFSAIGVLLIGFINIVVSFALTLVVAIKSLRINFNRSGELMNVIFAHFVFSTRDFFYPPKKKNPIFEKNNEN